jgi:hypothetical protein
VRQLNLEHEIVLHPQYLGQDVRYMLRRRLYEEVEGICHGM